MTIPRAALVVVLALTTGVACSHSDVFPTSPDRPDGPFDVGVPTRLTYSPGDDIWPMVSGPGLLSYQFRRGTPDRDICAGVMSTLGGSRRAEVCAWEADDAARSDLFGAAVLLDDGRFLWTRHESGTGNQSPDEGGLYLGTPEAPRTATRILPLLVQPAGASARWDLLVNPVQTGPDEITALAAQWSITPTVRFGPIDTIIRGIEIVRLGLGTVPATIAVLAPAVDAIAWGRDAGTGQLYYTRPTYNPPGEDSLFKPVADTVFRATSGGGIPIWGRPAMPSQVSGRITGLAVGGGKLVVARQWAEWLPGPAPAPPRYQVTSWLAELRDGVEQPPMAMRKSLTSDRWGRATLSPDGTGLIVESILPSGRDLYRFVLN